MADDKLKSFKIGDSHRPGMSAPAKKAGAQTDDKPESISLGFTRIETLLEKEDPVLVGEGLNALMQKLEPMAKSGATNRERAGAKAGMAAIERAVDLIDYLFQTKAAMEADQS